MSCVCVCCIIINKLLLIYYNRIDENQIWILWSLMMVNTVLVVSEKHGTHYTHTHTTHREGGGGKGESRDFVRIGYMLINT